MDKDCAKELMRSLKKLGFVFHLNHEVTKVEGQKDKALVYYKSRTEGEEIVLETDYCLLAIGRKAYTEGLGLEKVGIATDERGKIPVDENLMTNLPHVYAIGDVIKGAMLAHKAEEEGVFVAEHMAGQHPHIHYHLIPGVVYTWPEVASVGLTEQELRQQGKDLKIGKFPFKALGRARASMDLDGMVKIIADKYTDEVLGVHIVGARAADMIAAAVAVMEYRGSAEDISRMSHAHPTYMEAVKEAALAATDNRPIHV
jgi:dihydrolipoamide dehydrogenase